MVAEHRARVAPLHGELRGRRAAAGAGLASLEEVTEEDGVDLVFGVGLERLAEPVDVTLDVADDQGGRVTASGYERHAISRPRRPCGCAPRVPGPG